MAKTKTQLLEEAHNHLKTLPNTTDGSHELLNKLTKAELIEWLKSGKTSNVEKENEIVETFDDADEAVKSLTEEVEQANKRSEDCVQEAWDKNAKFLDTLAASESTLKSLVIDAIDSDKSKEEFGMMITGIIRPLWTVYEKELRKA